MNLASNPPLDPASPAISVVLPARNVAATIDRQLDALAAQDFAGVWELLVVDNGSTDDTVARVERRRTEMPGLQVLHCAPRGVSNARNFGVRRARADLIALCDGDDEVTPGWLRALVEALEVADLVGGPLSTERLNNAFVRTTRPVDLTALPTTGHLPWAAGASMAFRRVVFDAIGGFDQAWHYAGEDIDFWWRAQYAGFRPGFAPDAVVHYRLKDTVRAYTRQSYSYDRAQVDLATKHHALGKCAPWPARQVAATLPRRAATLVRLDRGFTRAGRWTYARNAAQFAAALVSVIRHREHARRFS